MHANLWQKKDRLIAEHMRRSREMIAPGIAPKLPQRIEFAGQLPRGVQARLDKARLYEEATKNLNVGTY